MAINIPFFYSEIELTIWLLFYHFGPYEMMYIFQFFIKKQEKKLKNSALCFTTAIIHNVLSNGIWLSQLHFPSFSLSMCKKVLKTFLFLEDVKSL